MNNKKVYTEPKLHKIGKMITLTQGNASGGTEGNGKHNAGNDNNQLP